MYRYMNERNQRPGRRERARHFQRDYDMNRGPFDPDIDLRDDHRKDEYRAQHRSDYNPHAYDQYEESERRFRRDEDRERLRAGFRGDFGTEFGGNDSSRDIDHHEGSQAGMGDRDYTRDYNLGTGTAMRTSSRDTGRISGDYGMGSQSAFFSDRNSDLNDRGFFGKGPKGWKRSDDRIREDACEALHDARNVDASDIEVEVKDGCVCLRGSVDGRDAKREAERSVEDLRGVTDVRNELQVKRQENITDLRRPNQGSESGRAANLS